MTPMRLPREVSRSATLSCTSMLRPTVRSSGHLTCIVMMTTQLGMERNDVTLTTHTNRVSMTLIGGLVRTVGSSVVSDWCISDDVELSLVCGWSSECGAEESAADSPYIDVTGIVDDQCRVTTLVVFFFLVCVF